MLVYIFPEDEYGSSPRSDGPIVTEYVVLSTIYTTLYGTAPYYIGFRCPPLGEFVEVSLYGDSLRVSSALDGSDLRVSCTVNDSYSFSVVVDSIYDTYIEMRTGTSTVEQVVLVNNETYYRNTSSNGDALLVISGSADDIYVVDSIGSPNYFLGPIDVVVADLTYNAAESLGWSITSDTAEEIVGEFDLKTGPSNNLLRFSISETRASTISDKVVFSVVPYPGISPAYPMSQYIGYGFFLDDVGLYEMYGDGGSLKYFYFSFLRDTDFSYPLSTFDIYVIPEGDPNNGRI